MQEIFLVVRRCKIKVISHSSLQVQMDINLLLIAVVLNRYVMEGYWIAGLYNQTGSTLLRWSSLYQKYSSSFL